MGTEDDFGSHHAGLFTGLGLEFVNYRLSNNVQLAYNNDLVLVAVISPEYRKNKLREIGLRVPLMLEFNTKRHRCRRAQLRDGSWKGATTSPARTSMSPLAWWVAGTSTPYKVKYRVGVRKGPQQGGLQPAEVPPGGARPDRLGGSTSSRSTALPRSSRRAPASELIPVNAGHSPGGASRSIAGRRERNKGKEPSGGRLTGRPR
ncbi:MAG: hypothetical protein IPL77_21540 [Flavobacteriales bacterium]|nr:hypothetical protein [Flavobacteriales bacterium]